MPVITTLLVNILQAMLQYGSGHVYQRLRKASYEAHVSMAEIIRDALADHLSVQP